jgi:two-component system sensor histidine kinase UhpB
VEVQENERHRIARELHDQVGQDLAILQLALSRLQKLAPTTEAAEALSEVREIAVEALKEVRQVSLDLRPGMLDDAGLYSTLREYAQTFSERSHIAVEVTVSGPEERLTPELEVTVFRIVQEAMTNTAKHAQASRVRLALSRGPRTLEVTVQDDGAGFDLEQALQGQRRRSLGLFGMEERCRLSGGELTIESRPGEGTRIKCVWEIPAASAAVAGQVS